MCGKSIENFRRVEWGRQVRRLLAENLTNADIGNLWLISYCGCMEKHLLVEISAILESESGEFSGLLLPAFLVYANMDIKADKERLGQSSVIALSESVCDVMAAADFFPEGLYFLHVARMKTRGDYPLSQKCFGKAFVESHQGQITCLLLPSFNSTSVEHSEMLGGVKLGIICRKSVDNLQEAESGSAMTTTSWHSGHMIIYPVHTNVDMGNLLIVSCGSPEKCLLIKSSFTFNGEKGVFSDLLFPILLVFDACAFCLKRNVKSQT
ncbi:hypothetical protein K438DRAFT_757409 [Mycena galopus ATCC 62051]|nr:hypothetical protein K438DRAFT_757409 [Mycena galopus ATCC 62051]